MTGYDFSPLFRSAVGFDRLQNMINSASQIDQSVKAFPPTRTQTIGENAFRVTMAVPGFGEGDISIEVRENTLLVMGKKSDDDHAAFFVHNEFGATEFARKFQLADHVKVVDAHMHNGLLTIDLVRELPEAMQPQQIEVKFSAPRSVDVKNKTTDKKAA